MTESKWEDARKCLDFATLYNPDYIKAWENYYLLGQSLQDAKLMRKALEEVVRLNPENIQAKQLLKSLR
jgi:tetratricopeptide (TPR) repeat protein